MLILFFHYVINLFEIYLKIIPIFTTENNRRNNTYMTLILYLLASLMNVMKKNAFDINANLI